MLSLQRLVVPVLLGLGVVMTLGREIVFAQVFGVSRELEVFRVAFSLPNMLSQSLAPAFIGALLPALVRASLEGGDSYDEFKFDLARVSFWGVSLLTFLGLTTASWQADVLAPGFDAASIESLSHTLRLCWLFFFLMALSFLPRLLLNNRNLFWPGSSTSVVISVCLILAALAIPAPADVSAWLAAGVIIAGVVVLALHLYAERNCIMIYVRSLGGFSTTLTKQQSSILFPLAAVLALHVLNTLPRFVDRAVASDLMVGAVAALDYSYNIITVPGILLGTSIITVCYPVFVRRINDPSQGGAGGLYILVSAAIVLAFAAGVLLNNQAGTIVDLIYARGAFDQSASAMTSTLLGWHALGLGFMVAALIFLQACVAYQAYGLLIVIGAIRLLSKWAAVELLVPKYGLGGLGASFVVPELTSTALLLALIIYLRRKTSA